MKLNKENMAILIAQAAQSREGAEASARGMRLSQYLEELEDCAKATARMKSINRAIALLPLEEQWKRQHHIAVQRKKLIIGSIEHNKLMAEAEGAKCYA